METGITTITFYKGDFNSSSNAIRTQFEKVIASNQWLSGRLVTGSNNITVLRHPINPTSKDFDELFNSINYDTIDSSVFKLTPNLSYETICTEMYKSNIVIVQSGYEVVDKNKALTKLTLIESLPGNIILIYLYLSIYQIYLTNF
jgi:hypothetical protein